MVFGSGLIVVVIGALLAAIAIAVGSAYLKRKRQQDFARFAILQGLRYAPEDPFGLVELPFALFGRGDGRGVENVIWGTWHGVPLHAFDYWYYVETRNAKGQTSRSYSRFECAVVPVDADLPPLTIDHENLFTRLADHLAMHDIEFESQAFNDAYNVKGDDERFAIAFIDTRMMDWLLADGGGFAFEASGGHLLVACRRLDPMGLTPVLGTARDFLAQVPRVVFSMYPKSG